MGVKECFRKDCENIMCDFYSVKHGYICDECFNELEDLIYAKRCDGIMHVDINKFMESSKNNDFLHEEDEYTVRKHIRQRLEKIFTT